MEIRNEGELNAEFERLMLKLIAYAKQKAWGDKAKGEDIVHDVYVKLINNFRKTGEPIPNLEARAKTAIKNRNIDIWKKEKRQTTGNENDIADEVLAIANDPYQMISIKRCIEELPRKFRFVIDQKAMGYTQAQISVNLSLRPNTVGVRIMRARKQLYECLNQ